MPAKDQKLDQLHAAWLAAAAAVDQDPDNEALRTASQQARQAVEDYETAHNVPNLYLAFRETKITDEELQQ